jgi:Ala-tRNA(Pro) deacylase
LHYAKPLKIKAEPLVTEDNLMRAEYVRAFLDDNHVNYEILEHTRAFTAQEIAAAAHIPGQELAKTVILQVKGVVAMAMLPAVPRSSLHT